MFRLYLYLLLHTLLAQRLSGSTQNATVTAFIEMVQSNLTACASYSYPTNNTKLYTVLSSEETTHDFGTFDFIIVGAGAAGTLLANRLTEISGWKVLLLEAGGHENDFSDIPGMAPTLALTEMNWGYLSAPQKRACKAMKSNRCVAPRGKVVGGSSTINAKQYVRGNKADYDEWEEMGNAGWSYKDVLPYFMKLEYCGHDTCDTSYRGKSGLLNVGRTDPSIFTPIYLKAMEELGYETIDYNAKNQIGASQYQYTMKGNKIASGGRTFIDPILKRKNLNLTTHAFVTSLIINRNNKTALGVRFTKNGKKYNATARKEVILSAGAVNTPQILMLSGIGPKMELQEIGVDPLVDLPVGKNMEDHAIFIGLNFRTNQTSFNQSLDVWLEEYLNNRRPLTAPLNVDSVGFINVNNRSSTVPDVQQLLTVPPGLTSLGLDYLNFKDITSLSKPYNDISVITVLLHPKSKGIITLKSNSSLDFPIIDYNYYAVEDDRNTIMNAINESLKLQNTEAFKSINASFTPAFEICTNQTQGSVAYWQCMVEHLTSTLYHIVGTTRMGTSTNSSVVNSTLLVHGMKRLRVVDAGVMPKIPSGNTVVPTYMIAEKAADIIKTYYNSSS